MNRRNFLTMGAAGAVGLLQARGRAAARKVDEFKYGESRIGISGDRA